AAEAYREAYPEPCWKTPRVGKAGLSWRVELLPFMEQDNLFRLLSQETKNFTTVVYEPDGRPAANSSAARGLLAIRLEDLTLPKRNYSANLTPFRRVARADRPNAFVVVETTDVVPWGKGGDDLVVEEGKPLPKMGGHFSGGFLALCADGKIRWLAASMSDEDKLAALFDGKGGEVQ